MALPTVLLYLAIAERLIRLWGNLKRALKRKEERDEKENGNSDGT